MTVKESILACPGLSDADDNLVNKVLSGRGLDATAEANADNDSLINLASADLYVWLLNSPDFSESKLSIAYPRSWWIKTAKNLYEDNGEPEKAKRIGFKATGKATNRW